MQEWRKRNLLSYIFHSIWGLSENVIKQPRKRGGCSEASLRLFHRLMLWLQVSLPFCYFLIRAKQDLARKLHDSISQCLHVYFNAVAKLLRISLEKQCCGLERCWLSSNINDIQGSNLRYFMSHLACCKATLFRNICACLILTQRSKLDWTPSKLMIALPAWRSWLCRPLSFSLSFPAKCVDLWPAKGCHVVVFQY